MHFFRQISVPHFLPPARDHSSSCALYPSVRFCTACLVFSIFRPCFRVRVWYVAQLTDKTLSRDFRRTGIHQKASFLVPFLSIWLGVIEIVRVDRLWNANRTWIPVGRVFHVGWICLGNWCIYSKFSNVTHYHENSVIFFNLESLPVKFVLFRISILTLSMDFPGKIALEHFPHD